MFERNRSEYAELACSAGAMFVTIAPIVQNFKMRRFEGKLGNQNLSSGSFTLCTHFLQSKTRPFKKAAAMVRKKSLYAIWRW